MGMMSTTGTLLKEPQASTKFVLANHPNPARERYPEKFQASYVHVTSSLPAYTTTPKRVHQNSSQNPRHSFSPSPVSQNPRRSFSPSPVSQGQSSRPSKNDASGRSIPNKNYGRERSVSCDSEAFSVISEASLFEVEHEGIPIITDSWGYVCRTPRKFRPNRHNRKQVGRSEGVQVGTALQPPEPHVDLSPSRASIDTVDSLTVETEGCHAETSYSTESLGERGHLSWK